VTFRLHEEVTVKVWFGVKFKVRVRVGVAVRMKR
jgi:hypothetical protein